MAKSIKLTNNTYIDSTSVSHNRVELKTEINNLWNSINSILNNKSIYDSGSNSYGSYIRFADGTMICYRTINISANITAAWGSLYIYHNTNEYNFALNFKSVPFVITDIKPTTGTGVFKANYEVCTITTSAITGFSVARPTSRDNVPIIYSILAIGRWR